MAGAARCGVVRSLLAAAAIALMGPGLAFAKGAPPSAPPVLRGTLQGSVKTEQGKPIAGAEISIDIPGRGPIKATTDAAGAFLMTGVPLGDVTVKIRARGCFPYEEHLVVAAKGATTLPATLKLGVRYSGRVVDARGAPIPGIHVRAVMLLKGDTLTIDDLWSSHPAVADTGAEGAFVLDGLEPSKRYLLRFKHPHYAKVELQGLPSKPGTVKEDIEVKMEDAAWVSGTVVDDAGKPVAGARVYGDPDFPAHNGAVIMFEETGPAGGKNPDENLTDEKGRFTVGGLTGTTADLQVDAEGFFVVALPFTGLVPGAERPGIEVKLERATATVQGVVIDSKGRAVPEASVWVKGDGGSTYVRADKSGRFQAAKVRSHGPVAVSADAPWFAETEVKDVPLNAKGIRLILQTSPKLKVKVTDGTGSPLGMVTVRVKLKSSEDEGGRGGSRSSVTSDQPEAGFVVQMPIGEVEATLLAEGYESKTIGPWTTKAGQDVDAGVVALNPKSSR